MRRLPVEELTPEGFKPFGTYTTMVNPTGEVFDSGKVKFFRDMIPAAILHSQCLPSFSVCRVEARPLVVDIAEYHTCTAEVNMALDADALVHLAPASPGKECPMDRFRIFRIPKGTLFTMNAGVWHHAPFVIDAPVLNMLVVLPERTYANDCVVVPFTEAEKFAIDYSD